MSLFSMMIPFMVEMEDCRAKNKEKIKEAKDLYWKACEMPRKKKKKARKVAYRDCCFWVSIDEHFNKIYP